MNEWGVAQVESMDEWGVADIQQPDNLASALKKEVIENTPEYFKMQAGGALRMVGEAQPFSRGADLVYGDARLNALGNAQETERVNALIANAPGRALDTSIADTGQFMYSEARDAVSQNQPVGLNAGEQFVVDVGKGIVNMGPAIALGVATGPAGALGALGAQVAGQEYGESRDSGRSRSEAQGDSIAQTLFEVVPETIPVMAILKRGTPALKRALDATLGEGFQESLTSVLEQTYNSVALENMTLGEAIRGINWGEAGYQGLVGMGVGGGLATATHPFVKDAPNDEWGVQKVEPTMPENVMEPNAARQDGMEPIEPSLLKEPVPQPAKPSNTTDVLIKRIQERAKQAPQNQMSIALQEASEKTAESDRSKIIAALENDIKNPVPPASVSPPTADSPVDTEASFSAPSVEPLEPALSSPAQQTEGALLSPLESPQPANSDLGEPIEQVAPDSPKATQRRFYRETSMDDLDLFLPNSNSQSSNPFGNIDVFASDNKDLALGQGSNKGVVLEFSGDSLSAKRQNSKPGSAIADGSEYILSSPTYKGFRNELSSVTIKPDAAASPGMRRRVQSRLDALVKNNGWVRSETNEGITYTRPDATIQAQTESKVDTKTEGKPAPSERDPIAAAAIQFPNKERYLRYLTGRLGKEQVAAQREQIDQVWEDNNGYNAPKLSRSGKPGGLPRSEVDRHVADFVSGWKEVPLSIKVIQSVNELPQNNKDFVYAHKAEKDAAGLYDARTDTFYVIGDHVEDAAHIQRLIFHDVVSHAGLRRTLPESQAIPLLNAIAKAKPRELQEIAEDYELDLSNPTDRLTAAEEVLAHMAEAGDKSTFVSRAVSLVKQFLRKHFPKLKVSDREIRGLIGRMARRVASGEKPIVEAEKPGFVDAVPEAMFFSRKGEPTGIDDSEPDSRSKMLWETFRFNAQDRFYYLRKVQDKAIKKRKINELPESEDAYLAELRYHGMAGTAIQDFQTNMVDPILDALSTHKISMEDFDQFLLARHAHEANEQLRKINPNQDDIDALLDKAHADRAKITEQKKALRAADPNKYNLSKEYKKLEKQHGAINAEIERIKRIDPHPNNDALSGMSDAKADGIITELKRTGKLSILDDLGKKVDEITGKRLDMLVSSGLEKADTVAAWRATYDHYVPLMREGKGDSLPPKGRGFDIRGKQKRRAGSEREAVNVFANVVAQYESTVVKAEKAKVAQAMLEFAKNNPNKDLYKVDEVEYMPSFDEHGLVRYVPDPTYTLADNVLAVKVGGETSHIVFNTENHDALKVVRALKRLGDPGGNWIVHGLSAINRWLSLVNTGANPEFMLSNPIRDIQTAAYNLSATEADKLKWKIIKDVGKAWRGIRQFQAGKHESEWSKTFDQFRKAGAQTGWMDMYKDIHHRRKALEKRIAHFNNDHRHNVRSVLSALENFIEAENTALENAVRLSAFKHATEAGISEAKAAKIAKEMTVNFNRKGDWGQVMNSLYLFYNASIQGQAIMLRAMKNRKVQGMLAATVVVATILDVLNRSLGGEDDDGTAFYDKIPDYVKDRNLIIMTGMEDGEYIKIPLPWGYNVFHVVGQVAGEAISKPGFKATEGSVRLIGSVVDAFNPVGGSASISQLLSPTITDPIIQWGENKDFRGAPLRPESNPFDIDKPESQKYWGSVREPSRLVAEYLNKWTGGDEVRSGWADFSPEALDLLIDTATGGAGRVIADTVSTPIKAIKGEEVESYEIPLARKLYGKPGFGSTQQEFYKNAEAVRLTEKQFKHYATLQDKDKIKQVRSEYAKELQMIQATKMANKQLRQLRKQKKQLEISKINDQAKQVRIDTINERMEKVMKAYNKQYNKVVLGLH